MKHVRHELVAVKRTTNRIDDDRINKQLVELCAGSIGKTLRQRGWSARRPRVEVVNGDGYTYTATIQFHRDTAREFTPESADRQWADITRKFASRGKSRSWSLSNPGVAGDSPRNRSDATPQPVIPEFAGAGAIRIPSDWHLYFHDLYNVDDQIVELMQSIRTAADTGLSIRNHVMLYGPPGCGKTEVGLCLERMLGPDCVLKLDATNTTKAGAENLILEREPIPPILILEELEKCDEANVPWLLGIMDDRGEIVKTNARIGSVRRRAPMLVICTVNNLQKFNSFQEGALANRFNVPLYFGMPDRDLLRKILMREVVKIPGGRVEWIEPALDYALNEEGTYQARRIKAIMSNARDGLLDGSYQAARRRMRNRQDDDLQKLVEFKVNF